MTFEKTRIHFNVGVSLPSPLYLLKVPNESRKRAKQVPVVQRAGNFIQRISHYPADKMVGVHFIRWRAIYPALGRVIYSLFERLGPERWCGKHCLSFWT